MGILSNALTLERKADTALVAGYEAGRPIAHTGSIPFEKAYREGYSANEIVFACLDLIADTASEPSVVAHTGPTKAPTVLPEHPAAVLINNPNPFYSRFDMIGLTQIDLGLAGNSYQRLEFSRRRLPVELWRMRPDQVEVIPDRHTYIRGYVYRMGNEEKFLEPERVIHFRTRDPYNQFYGMPPLLPLAGRIDIDAYMLTFVRAFFENAGVPAGMLTLNRILSRQDKRDVGTMFRQETGGRKAFSVLVVDGDGTAKYTPIGASLSDSAVAMPAVDEIVETRITGAMRIPQSLVGTRLGNQSAAYANRKADQQHFWRSRQVPEFERLGAAYTRALKVFWPDTRIVFDLSQVEALSEDQKELHDRIRADYESGLVGQEEARQLLGYPAKVPSSDVFMIRSSAIPTLGADIAAPPEEPAALPEPPPEGAEDEDEPPAANGEPR